MAKSTKISALATATLLTLSGCAGIGLGDSNAPDSEVGVQLFMWNWDSVAKECQEVLGPAGVDWVLVAPPQEHIQGDQWWIHYQPVSYKIESALGNREQFEAMNKACGDAGVKVIADAVINHMAAQDSGVGFAGTEFSKYEYPGLYTYASFHDCGGQISDYYNKEEVQNCELLGLSDLNQSLPEVQKTILAYLNDLISLGVDGFRIDAAKHIAAEDLKAITDQLPEGIKVLQEVIRGGGEPIQPEDYLESGMVWEFDYMRNLKTMFLDKTIMFDSLESRLSGHSPSEKTISFVSNHDTERNQQAINYLTSEDFAMATAFMLADNYGEPMLLSSYAFDSYDAAPLYSDGKIPDVVCVDGEGPQPSYSANQWICQHRWPSTLAMIKFRDYVGDAPLIELRNSDGIVAFERESKGLFIASLAEQTQQNFEFSTSLPDGKYCNVYKSTVSEKCAEIIEVLEGKVSVPLALNTVIALHIGAKP
ncbi:MAG: hypothetical protein RLZZ579_1032 [Actinomycetota bacterium]|jgi:alpha-amylase